ncbi:MAG TPA: group II truncated hemoglobin [Kribbella sp.]
MTEIVVRAYVLCGGEGRGGAAHRVPQRGIHTRGLPNRACTWEAWPMESLYEHAGGHEGIHHFVDIFYSSVLADPVLQPLFGAGHPEHVTRLTAFDSESFGGPDTFSTDLGGFAGLIAAHRDLRITEEQRLRFVELYLAAADKAGLPDDQPFRQALREHVEFGSHVAVQNSHATTDAELHPLREVPTWDWPQPSE